MARMPGETEVRAMASSARPKRRERRKGESPGGLDEVDEVVPN